MSSPVDDCILFPVDDETTVTRFFGVNKFVPEINKSENDPTSPGNTETIAPVAVDDVAAANCGTCVEADERTTQFCAAGTVISVY